MELPIKNDAVVLGMLLAILALVFYTANSKIRFFQKFYSVVPSILLCYFLPSLLNLAGIVDPEESNLYFVSSRYLLPASLVLLTLSIDLKAIMNLGPKALIMFFAGTVGIMFGGPLAILIISAFSPETVGGAGPDAVWRGMTTIAGSWIGGGANQTAMKEIFEAGDKIFSAMITVDVLVANAWMAVLLLGVGISDKLDKFLKADNSAITELKKKIENYQSSILKVSTTTDLMIIIAVGITVTGIAHFFADIIAPAIEKGAPQLAQFSLTSTFFWIIVVATTLGIGLSFTKARKLEGAGASKIGSIFLYILVASIGMHMDLTAIVEHKGVFLIGIIWMLAHVSILFIVGKLIRAPYFFIAVGSQANVGGAASAPIVASAFSPVLAPVGVLLAVLGYALGTYGALLCGYMMEYVSP